MFLRKAPFIRLRPPKHLNLRFALLLMVVEVLLGTGGFMIIEGYDLIEGFYMTIITISTVGFTEVEPLSPAGRVFTSAFILVNVGIFAYLLAAFSYYVIEGQIFRSMQLNRIRETIDKLQNHIILCGYGKYGKEIALHLKNHDTTFVIIDNNTEVIDFLQKGNAEMLYLEGDATQDEVLLRAGIDRAHGLISALSDDSDNLYIVLSARQLNPRLQIISRAVQPRSENKLIKAGANHVVMPDRIGGFYMATLISKPGAVEFFTFITNEYQSDIGFEEVRYEHLPQEARGKPIHDLHLRKGTGVNIIGFRTRGGKYLVNPTPDIILREGDSFIVLGSDEQLEKLRTFLQQ